MFKNILYSDIKIMLMLFEKEMKLTTEVIKHFLIQSKKEMSDIF